MMSKVTTEDFKDYAMEAALLEAQQKRHSQSNPGPNEPFPVQLHWMLEQAEEEGISHIVRWSPHGRAFVVHKRDLFVEKVLPVYFNQSKFTSFQRQLSLYGFKRLTKGADRGGYYHPMFLRLSRTFTRNIARTKVKNEGPRKAAAPEMEPDFYLMPKLAEAISRADSFSGGRATSVGQASPSQVTTIADPMQQQQQLPHSAVGNLIPSGSLGNSFSCAAGSPTTLASLSVPDAALLQNLNSPTELQSNLLQLQRLLQNRRESMLRPNETTLPTRSSQSFSMPNLFALNRAGLLNPLSALAPGGSHASLDSFLQANRQNQQTMPVDLPQSSQLATRRTSESQAAECLSGAIEEMLRQANSPAPRNPPYWG